MRVHTHSTTQRRAQHTVFMLYLLCVMIMVFKSWFVWLVHLWLDHVRLIHVVLDKEHMDHNNMLRDDHRHMILGGCMIDGSWIVLKNEQYNHHNMAYKVRK